MIEHFWKNLRHSKSTTINEDDTSSYISISVIPESEKDTDQKSWITKVRMIAYLLFAIILTVIIAVLFYILTPTAPLNTKEFFLVFVTFYIVFLGIHSLLRFRKRKRHY